MSAVRIGDTVTFHYTGMLSDGSTFDSSIGRDPMGAKLGEGHLIPGFENALLGMKAGDSKSFTITAAEAYGERQAELVQVFESRAFPEGTEIEVGQVYEMVNHKGDPMPFTVVAIEEENVTVDANHRLAGQDLTFSLELIEIQQES